MYSKINKLIFLSLLVSFLSCSSYQKILSSKDYPMKYDAAMKYVEEKEYNKAFPILEELVDVGVFRGTEKSEKLYYTYAYAYYHRKDYELAAHYFSAFYRNFTTSPLAEDALYRQAYCWYLQSPEPNLDYSSTEKAIQQLQIFTNTYPQSGLVKDCNKLIDNLRGKIELKTYNNAKLLYKISDYKGAIVALENFATNYPLSIKREESMYLHVRSHYLLAENSNISKQKERYEKTTTVASHFIESYPQSNWKDNVETIQRNSSRKITEKQL